MSLTVVVTRLLAYISSGFVVFPDIPSRKRPFTLTRTDHAIARKRFQGESAPPALAVSKGIFRRVLGRWHFYAFVCLWTLFDLNFAVGGQPFSLYLKAYSPKVYSVVQVNTLPTIVSAISIVAAFIAGITADRLGRFWVPAFVTSIPVLVGMILLNVWNVGEKGRLAAFMLQGFIARKYTLFRPQILDS